MFRRREVELAKRSLLDGTSLLVKGWRRIGKSSLLVETRRQIEDGGIVTSAYIDVQELQSVSEFFTAFLNSLPQNTVQQLRSLWDGAKRLPGRMMDAIQRRVKSANAGGGGFEAGVEFERDIRDYWEPLKASVETLAREHLKAGTRIVLLIDELPFFLENMHRKSGNVDDIRLVLATLRAWRNAGLAMAIAGSVSIEAFLEDLKIEGLVINDLTRIDLQPLTETEATAFTETLANVAGLQEWNNDSTKALLEELPDHFPFFIQTAMNFLRVETQSTPDVIADVFENQVHPQIFASFYQQFDERLERRFEDDLRKAAEAVLNKMASRGDGRITNAEIQALCSTLGQDPLRLTRRLEMAEFIRTDLKNSGYRLVQNLLKTWRQARGGL
jgi:AAA+ ATPase superfamily predicted ATPase